MEPLVGAGPGVREDDVRAKRAREHLEQRDLAHEGVDDRLQDLGERLAGRIGGDLDLPVAGPGAHPPVGGDLADQREQALEADLRRRRAADDGDHRRLRHPSGEGPLELLGRGRVAVEVAGHELVVRDDDALDEVVVDPVLPGRHVLGDGYLGRLAPLIDRRRVGEEVDHPSEVRLGADRQLERGDAAAEGFSQVVKRPLEVGPLPVELVDEHDAGPPQPLGQAPEVARLDLDALHGAHHHDRDVGGP